MNGNTLSEFMNDLFTCGGPEKEFVFRDKRYFLEITKLEESNLLELYIFEVSDTDDVVFSCLGKTFRECAEQFEEAKIFDGKNIYQVEHEITVLFG